MKNLLFTAALVTVTSLTLQAQSARNTWGLGIHPGVYSFYATQGNNVFNGKTYSPGVELSAMRYLGKYFDLGLETNFARIGHPGDTATAAAAALGNYGLRDNFLSGHLGLRFRLDGGLLDPKSNFVPFLKVGVGGTSYGDFKQWSVYVPVGLGFHIHVPKSPVTFTLQSNYNAVFMMPNDAKPSGFLHHSLGISVQLGKHKKNENNVDFLEAATTGKPKALDRDYDGIPDEIDQCPDIFGSANTVGCPDTDGDQIKDADDKCPEVWGFANLKGCMDTDLDGVIDPDDQCPNEYAESETGCPGLSGTDDDGDGIPNDQDLCPSEKGLFTAKGCPDNDGDGIQNSLDMCPDYYGTNEHAGCPLPKSQLDSLREMVNRYRDKENFVNKGYAPRGEKQIEDKFGNLLSTDKNGDIVDAKGKKLTTTGGYKIENGLVTDKDGKNIRVGDDGYLYAADNTRIDTKENLWVWSGTNNDPSGLNNGSIYLGNFSSDKYGGMNLTGITPPVRLSPEEEAYCQRLDLASLRAAIYFDYDHSSANPNSMRTLGKVVEAMRKCAILELQIAGHADADGDDSYNLELSERRAKAILRYIAGEGISDRRLKYNAYGEKYPIAPNNSNDGKSQNRRAEIKVQRAY